MTRWSQAAHLLGWSLVAGASIASIVLGVDRVIANTFLVLTIFLSLATGAVILIFSNRRERAKEKKSLAAAEIAPRERVRLRDQKVRDFRAGLFSFQEEGVFSIVIGLLLLAVVAGTVILLQ